MGVTKALNKSSAAKHQSRLKALTQSSLRLGSSGNLYTFTLFALLQRRVQPTAQQLDGMFLPYKIADTIFT